MQSLNITQIKNTTSYRNYAEYHSHPINKIIHIIFIPLLVICFHNFFIMFDHFLFKKKRNILELERKREKEFINKFMTYQNYYTYQFNILYFMEYIYTFQYILGFRILFALHNLYYPINLTFITLYSYYYYIHYGLYIQYNNYTINIVYNSVLYFLTMLFISNYFRKVYFKKWRLYTIYLFIFSWTMQFMGHYIEGNYPVLKNNPIDAFLNAPLFSLLYLYDFTFYQSIPS